jgi:AraC family transcriptional regulator of adaptative response/methylated-DNA-[protein]-cysteine methyltransferase
VAYLIPCHRVIRETGVIGDYRWGAVRKKAMLAWEQGQTNRAVNMNSES